MREKVVDVVEDEILKLEAENRIPSIQLFKGREFEEPRLDGSRAGFDVLQVKSSRQVNLLPEKCISLHEAQYNGSLARKTRNAAQKGLLPNTVTAFTRLPSCFVPMTTTPRNWFSVRSTKR